MPFSADFGFVFNDNFLCLSVMQGPYCNKEEPVMLNFCKGPSDKGQTGQVGPKFH